MSQTTTADPAAPAADVEGFIDPVSMEEDPAELFAGDSGTLDADVRTVLVRLLQRRFLLADKNRAQWRTLLDNQQVIESRLHDLFVHLVVDHERGVAYKRQVRSAELDVPVLLRDEAYTRAETLVLVHLRTVFQRLRGAGETSARVDVEEIEQTALTYFDPQDTNLAARQREIRTAVARLAKEGIVEEESEGRYRVTPLVEVVLSNERLVELREWLREQVRTGGTPDLAEPEPEPEAEPGSEAEPEVTQDPSADVQAGADDPGPTLEEAAALAADENPGADEVPDGTPEAEEVAR
jgi:predicted transcriptional regulator